MSRLNQITTNLVTFAAVLCIAAGCHHQTKTGGDPLLPPAQSSGSSSRAQNPTTADNPDTSGQHLAGSAVSTASGDDENHRAEWLTSYERAVEISKQTGKPILADFTGSNWCGPCIKLKQQVLSTDEFKNWAADNVVLLEVDYPRPNRLPPWLQQQNQALKERYQIDRYPTVLLLASDGGVVGKLGYMNNASSWISVASNSIATHQSLQTATLVEAATLKTIR